MTGIPGIFACGNVLHVHDLVDWVSLEASQAGTFAAHYVLEGRERPDATIPVRPGDGVRYTLPQTITGEKDCTISLRVTGPSRNRSLVVKDGARIVKSKRIVRLHPAEMIRVDLKVSDIENCKSLEVTVE
jgi:hypothetical protein